MIKKLSNKEKSDMHNLPAVWALSCFQLLSTAFNCFRVFKVLGISRLNGYKSFFHYFHTFPPGEWMDSSKTPASQHKCVFGCQRCQWLSKNINTHPHYIKLKLSGLEVCPQPNTLQGSRLDKVFTSTFFKVISKICCYSKYIPKSSYCNKGAYKYTLVFVCFVDSIIICVLKYVFMQQQ